MKIKKGDNVIVIAGDDKGKTGIVQKVDPKSNRVTVEGINIHKKHKKPTQATPEGSILDIYVPIDASNVMLYDKKAKKGIRVHHKIVDGKKIRVSAKGDKLD